MNFKIIRRPIVAAMAVAAMVCLVRPTCAAQESSDLRVVDHGRSSWEIVRDPDGPQDVRIGAAELQRLIEKATGARLPIVAKATRGRGQIVVGEHALSRAAGIAVDKLPHDGSYLLARNGRIFLIGRDDQGALYQLNNHQSVSAGSYFAVVEFARRFLHVRWYMPTELGEEAPHADRLSVPADLRVTDIPVLQRRGIPPLRSRDVSVTVKRLQAEGRSTATWSQENWNESVKWGRRLRLGNGFPFSVSHSWFQWMPAEAPNPDSGQAYGKIHPEWYALVNGKRDNHYYGSDHHHGGQLCVSNAAMRAQFAANIIAYAKRTGRRHFSLSPNDGGTQCQCDRCRAWGWGSDPNQGHATMTDRIVRFANDIARRVRKEIPDATFGLYAYSTYNTPPTVQKVDPSITISDVRNNMPFLYFTSGRKQVMEANLRGWRQAVSRIVFTTYYPSYGFWSLPWSTSDVEGWLLTTMGAYPASQGCYLAFGGSDPPALGALGPDLWVCAQLMWNPKQSVTDLQEQWYQGCFGPEIGPLIHQYFDAIHDSMAKAIEAHPWQRVSMQPIYLPMTYGPIRRRCQGLIDRAVELAAAMPRRYQWRVDRIARGWRLATLTLDAMAAGKASRAAPADVALMQKAVQLGQARLQLLNDPKSQFALAPNAAVGMDRRVPLGILNAPPEHTSLDIPRLDDAPVIDGRLNDPVWRQAAATAPFVKNHNGRKSLVHTTARIFFNARGVYVGFECAEPQMARLKVVDDPKQLWNGDVAEIFIALPSRPDRLIHLMVNPNGVAWAKNAPADWSAAAARNGNGWTAEFFIPTDGSVLPAPTAGPWMADLFRERYTDSAENSGWVATHSDFAKPVRFGFWKFSRSRQQP